MMGATHPGLTLERLHLYVDVGDCWQWTRATSRGYGKTLLQGKQIVAHRAIYQMLVGPIPEGLVLDHLCRNRICVNPDHLEPVTVAENNRRAGSQNPTRCARGHLRTERNTYTWRGRIWCRACIVLNQHAYQDRKRAA